MMITVLLILALVAALMGYRFFGKLLQLASFEAVDAQQENASQAEAQTSYPDPAASRAPAPHASVQMLHQALALSGLGTAWGAMLSVYWGWVPGYLWILAGTLLGSTVYGMAGVWFGSVYPGADLPGRCAGRGHGTQAALLPAILNLLILVLGLLLAAAALWTAATLLGRYPGATLPLLTMLLLARWFGRRPGVIAGAWGLMIVASLVAWLATGWLSVLPVSFSGALNLDFAGKISGSAGAYSTWVALLALLAYPALRRESSRFARPRAMVFAGPALLLLLAITAGLIVRQPALTAPEFRSDPALAAFPWLSVVLLGSVLTGLQLLLTHSLTARGTPVSEVRKIGFGAALINGAVALLGLFAGASLAGEKHNWSTLYGDWGALLAQPANLLARLAGAWSDNLTTLGASPMFATSAIALVLAGLALVSLDALLRLTEQRLARLAGTALARPVWPLCGPVRRRRRLVLWLVLLLALGPGEGILSGILAAGLLLQWLTLTLLRLLTLWLQDRQRWFWPLLLPAAVLALTLSSACVSGLLQQARAGQWPGAAAHLGLLLLTGLTVLLLARTRNNDGQAMSTKPRA